MNDMASPSHNMTSRNNFSRYLGMLLIGAILALTGHGLCRAIDTPPQKKITLFFFWGTGCPHCEQAKPFVNYLRQNYPQVEVYSLEIVSNKDNLILMEKMARERGARSGGVPQFILGDRVFVGYSDTTAAEIEAALQAAAARESSGVGVTATGPPRKTSETAALPFFGEKDPQSLSLPVFTVVIAGLDSFNPCAFFVLFTLLSLLVRARSRKRMLLIGGVFIVTSGSLYFLFMAAWMNFYLVVGHLSAVTWIAGVLALAIALINMKDFFLFKRGLSLSIPESFKPRLFKRMRDLLHTASLPAALAGSIVLAVAANSYELLCTAGFPMVYTRVLTLNSLSTAGYYFYLALYNIVYMIPLGVIVSFFVFTLGSRKLTEWQGRVMKLASGLMMLGLASVLLLKPALLQNILSSFVLLLGVLLLSALIAWFTKKYFQDTQGQ